MYTYHGKGTDQHVRRVAFRGYDLIDEVGSYADDGDERSKLHRPESREGHAEGAELRCLKTHSQRDICFEVGYKREFRTGTVGLEDGAQRETPRRIWERRLGV